MLTSYLFFIKNFQSSYKKQLIQNNLVINNRCQNSTGVYIEKEYNILFRCNAYLKLKKLYVPYNFTHEPSVQKLYTLSNTQDSYLIVAITEFILKALNNRLGIWHAKLELFILHVFAIKKKPFAYFSLIMMNSYKIVYIEPILLLI